MDISGLLGPNGAGKTTLIRIINHITAPDSGNVYFDGHILNAQDVYNIGYLPEERGLYKKMKVGEQAVFFARLKGLSKKEATQRLKEWFERFDILNWWEISVKRKCWNVLHQKLLKDMEEKSTEEDAVCGGSSL